MTTIITQQTVDNYNDYNDTNESIESLQIKLDSAVEQFLFDRDGKDVDRFNEQFIDYNEYLANENLNGFINCREFLNYVNHL